MSKLTRGQLTHDEHMARAMLMQRQYLSWANAYARDSKAMDETSSRWIEEQPWIDADTLEPIDLNEISLRISASLDENPSRDLGLDDG